MSDCLFCKIASKAIPAVTVHEDDELLAFLDICPIRPGHTLIIPKAHHEWFEALPADLGAKILVLGQRLARRMKEIYRVERVAFFFSGQDVTHAHAHVVPMHDKTDLISARHISDGRPVTIALEPLRVDVQTLRAVRDELGQI